jgi:hypothetical protein
MSMKVKDLGAGVSERLKVTDVLLVGYSLHRYILVEAGDKT